MAELNQIPRKRMRFTSSSTIEILATTKSHNQRDRNRRVAAAASHNGNGFRVHHSPSLTGKIDTKITRTYPRVTIKDLRLRRVFSPTSISTAWEFKTKGENQTKEHDDDCSNIEKEGIKVNAGELGNGEVEEVIQTTPPDQELLSNEPICDVISEPAMKKSGTNLSSKSVLHPCSRAKIFKNHGSFSYKRLLPYLMQTANDGTSSGRCSRPEKPIGQNPPSINIDKDTGKSGEDPKEEVSELMTAKCQLPETTKPVSQSVDIVFNNHSSGNTSPLKKVIASSPNKKSVCSRRKLFKTPGSVNYRRMLPYVRDIQEDIPCVPETVNHPDHNKNTDENTPSSMLVSENEETLEMVPSNVASESDSCFNEKKEPLPCEHVSVSPERSDPDKEQETQIKHVISDTEKNLEALPNVLCSEVPLSPPLSRSISSSEVASSALNIMLVKNMVAEENMNDSKKTEAKNSVERLDHANSSCLAIELLDPSAVLETPPPSKGILKRSRRGCRGICSCLNCSSFRLNAERAFEFSRNQLKDTEVMVLDLVGEISYLREMLEKYDSANHIEINKTQICATKRAFEASELAKSRLHQMNEDLQVHCRIPNEQRARVKFAHYIHEKTIVKASEPNKVDL